MEAGECGGGVGGPSPGGLTRGAPDKGKNVFACSAHSQRRQKRGGRLPSRPPGGTADRTPDRTPLAAGPQRLDGGGGSALTA